MEAFAARGDKVYFLYEKCYDAAREVAQITGATGICCDVADGEAVKKAFSQIPQVDILVCNAGISVSGLLQDLPEDRWNRLFDVNVKGMYLCIREALPAFFRSSRVRSSQMQSRPCIMRSVPTDASQLWPQL